jgi:hypothetical protein
VKIGRFRLDWKVLAGLGVVVLAALVAAPGLLVKVLPLLLLAACPLSMLVMMGGMAGIGRKHKQGHAAAPQPADLPSRTRAGQRAELQAQLADLQGRQEALESGLRELEQKPDPAIPAAEEAQMAEPLPTPVKDGHSR